MEPRRVVHGQPEGRPARRLRGHGHRSGRLRRQVSGLGAQRPASLCGHLLKRVAEPGGDRGGHGSLHERRLGEQDALASALRQQVQGHLRREDGAAEVHQDQDAVLRPHLLDGARDAPGVGAERVAGLVEAAGDPDAQPVAAHLSGQLGHALGELRAVAHKDEGDHGYVPGRAEGAPGANASAAACIRSHDEVAPGS